MSTTKKDKKGYHVFADSGKYVHRWVASKKYGKESIIGKEIHHLDGDKDNNQPSNLIKLDKEDHYELTQHENRKNLVLDIILGACIIYFINLILSLFVEFQASSIRTIMRLSVLAIFFITLNLKYNIIRKTIRKPNEKNFKD
jgi:hypothetical protein